MLWEVEIRHAAGQKDREGNRVLAEAASIGASSITHVTSARSYLIEGDLEAEAVNTAAAELLADPVVETCQTHRLPDSRDASTGTILLNVLFRPGVTDNVGQTASQALKEMGLAADQVATCRKYWINSDARDDDLQRLCSKVLANDAIEHIVRGPLPLSSIALGGDYQFALKHVPIREMEDQELLRLSREGQLYLSLVEMQTIQSFYRELGREPTDIELETIAQTWSEHCSHKTLAGRIAYRDPERGVVHFENMLKETIFAATQTIRQQLGDEDWCVSVFKDNAGIVRFNNEYDVCIKVETHNHPSAVEPYGGANTGLGGVIRDPLGTGLGAKPVCNTDVFCFASPEISYDDLPPGVLHPRTVMRGVVSGVRDYGNRMGIPTVNGAVFFDNRYLGNPLVYCGNIALIPRGKSEKRVAPGDYIVTVGGRTGRDGIHGATFSSAELTQESEELSGGAVQIGNAITEKMVVDVILEARDRELYHAITDCGAGGFSSAVGEMGEETGAEVWLDKAPLKYSGLNYTEIWISEAQERMVLAVPPENWDAFHSLCDSEGVEATVIGTFTDTGRLVLKYQDRQVADLPMAFLHGGRPPVVREALFEPQRPSTHAGTSNSKQSQVAASPAGLDSSAGPGQILHALLSSLNVCSKEWIIRQYDHEVQAGSVVKPLVGHQNDGPSDAAVVQPDLASKRGIVIACGMNPRYGDSDPYWMAVAAIDEAIRNCVAVGADPARIAILDNFCWGNTERPETLGSLVRAALGCQDAAIAFQTPFVSGKDSLNNEFTYTIEPDESGEFPDSQETRTISIPPSLLITALGQIEDITQCITMDLKESGNLLFQIGPTKGFLGGSHYNLVTGQDSGEVPRVEMEKARKSYFLLHQAIRQGLIWSCHDLSEGGLAVALAEMAFAGGLGVDVTLGAFESLDEIVILFDESPSRFVVEIMPDAVSEFLQLIPNAIPLGSVTVKDRVIILSSSGEILIDESCESLKTSWQTPLNWD